MKLLKSVVSVLTASMMYFTFSGAVYAQALEQQPDAFEKISERLLEKYGVNSSNYSSQSVEQVVESSSEELPVMIWCTQDIDYTAVEQKALPILTETMKTASTFSVSSISSVEDVLANAESLSDETIQEFIESERAESRKMYEKLNGEFIEKYMSDEEIIYISQYSPVILANLTLNKVVDLAESPDTLEFSYAGLDGERTDDMANSMQATKTDIVHETYKYTGKGVKIGQMECNNPSAGDSQLAKMASNHLHFYDLSGMHSASHATWVADILVGQKTDKYPSGVAPDADLYCTSIADFGIIPTPLKKGESLKGEIGSAEWLISQGVNVINCSIAFGDSVLGTDDQSKDANLYNSCAKWLDHISAQHHVIFVKSSGNLGVSGVNSGGMAYNIITVGNVDDKNTPQISDDIIEESSSFYSASTRLAYKPDLCAPGTNIVNSGIPEGDTGTSASTPHVAGAVALLTQAKPALKLQPATVKAILTATVGSQTSKRFCPSAWSSDPNNENYNKYTKYGAGLLDTKKAIDTAEMGNYYSSKLNPARNEEQITMNVTSSESTVRVSLAFLKDVTISSEKHTNVESTISKNLDDLDLIIFDPDGKRIASSLTSTNNVEIAEFTAPKAGTYTIKVYKVGSALTHNVEYGVSWYEWVH